MNFHDWHPVPLITPYCQENVSTSFYARIQKYEDQFQKLKSDFKKIKTDFKKLKSDYIGSTI